ncbi:MAG TPA: CDGSH iron-sulfur domain-containing protein [Acidimicrobiales bacterium]|nr:CDGSH iron-sulfur domain-containing protein [Acidimicrobiales bacterium]
MPDGANGEEHPVMSEPTDTTAVHLREQVADLQREATALALALAATDEGRPEGVEERLGASVIRPLGRVVPEARDAPAAPDAEVAASAAPADRLWELAKTATRLRASGDAPSEVVEATAALQDLACQPAPGVDAAVIEERLAELRELQAGVTAAIQVADDGPYLVTGGVEIHTWLGEPVPTRPQMALCRCGRSQLKPLCDGTHAAIGFSGEKDPKRVADRRDTYVGQQVTVLDNRGICQHSGFCSDRLNRVFHADSEPFVTPSGGRMDEIIRAVRDCPSGALSFAIDGREAREQVDQPREPGIEVSKDGPYRVTGGPALVDGHGNDVPRAAGASREHYALCRCGQSQNKPFCSGMHFYVEFRDPVPDPDREPTMFEWVGGLPALTRMTRLFYEKYVPDDPLLAPLFAEMSVDHPERVAKWLAEVFGGPSYYSDTFGGYNRMLGQHLGRSLTEAQRARWASLISQAAKEAGLPNDAEFQAAFHSYIEWGTRLAVENSQPESRPPLDMPMPHWDWDTAAGPPWGRASALAPPDEEDDEAPPLPGPGEPLSFAAHIKPLFRSQDRRSMRFAFDLWSNDDVRQHAEAILERIRDGSMPCDGAWPEERIAVLERWIASGCPNGGEEAESMTPDKPGGTS